MPPDPDAHLLRDLRVVPRDRLSPPALRVADTQARLPPPALADLDTTSGRQTLAQALTLRLLTARGELGALGHPGYGSRLHELLGRPNTATTRSLATLHVLEALRDERRIAAVSAVRVDAVPGRPQQIAVTVTVLPAPAGEAVTVGPLVLDLDTEEARG